MGTASKFVSLQHADELINRLQDHIAKVLNPLVASPLNGAVLVKNVTLKLGVNVVPHPLGRRPQGWHLARVRVSGLAVYDLLDTQPEDATKVIRLNASGAATVDILFF